MLKKNKLLAMFLFVAMSLEANYCIQVLSASNSDEEFILNEAKSENYNQFPNIRVENRGRYLVFRIGDYPNYNDAKEDINAIRRASKDAYIRKCDFVKEKAIYIKNETGINHINTLSNTSNPNSFTRSIHPSYQEEQRTYEKEIISHPVYSDTNTQDAKNKKIEYAKKQELSYSNSQSKQKTLWEDCKKCFIPIYEDDESPDSEPRPKSVPEKQVVYTDEIEVRVQEKRQDKKSFWADDITNAEQKHKSKNKFNIDEQFLP
ncbi:hypothetical protein KJ877_08115 [bacterium]|nr:hypothetical protein [bacterium]MBU1990972.1 hypothetical protein [bacterium]